MPTVTKATTPVETRGRNIVIINIGETSDQRNGYHLRGASWEPYWDHDTNRRYNEKLRLRSDNLETLIIKAVEKVLPEADRKEAHTLVKVWFGYRAEFYLVRYSDLKFFWCAELHRVVEIPDVE